MDQRLSFAILLLTILAATAVYPTLKKPVFSDSLWRKVFLLFAGTLAVALPVWRLRSLAYNGEINVDESLIIAQAMRYLDDPVPWRSVNGGSGGPLNTWILLWAPLLGVKFGYLAARITGLACTFLMILGTALSIREFVGNKLALLLTLPMCLLLCGTLNLDFVHFSSEQLPAAICTWVVWLILLQAKRVSQNRAFMVGLLTGALPFTKLQVAPAAVLLFLIALTITIHPWMPPKSFRAGSLLLAGGLAVPALILVPVAICGAWGDFVEFYLLEGLRYKNVATATSPSALQFLMRGSVDFTTYWTVFGGVALCGLGSVLFQFTNKRTSLKKPWLIGLGIVTAYSLLMTHLATRTGMGFPHYLMLLIAPTSLWFAACLGNPVQFLNEAKEASVAVEQSRTRDFWLVGGVSLVLLMQCFTFVRIYRATPQFVGNWGNPVHPIVPLILQFATPQDRMFVWGWAPKFHVLTGIPPATRFTSNGLLTASGDLPERYRRRLREDLEKAKPKLILDATEEFRWPTWPPGLMAGHQAVPELAELVFRNYRQVKRFDVRPGGQPFMIFERKQPTAAPGVREN